LFFYDRNSAPVVIVVFSLALCCVDETVGSLFYGVDAIYTVK